ncbi:MAG: hypothetical protein WCT39_02660 [Candidatus Margulisiibacteriota bacterium]
MRKIQSTAQKPIRIILASTNRNTAKPIAMDTIRSVITAVKAARQKSKSREQITLPDKLQRATGIKEIILAGEARNSRTLRDNALRDILAKALEATGRTENPITLQHLDVTTNKESGRLTITVSRHSGNGKKTLAAPSLTSRPDPLAFVCCSPLAPAGWGQAPIHVEKAPAASVTPTAPSPASPPKQKPEPVQPKEFQPTPRQKKIKMATSIAAITLSIAAIATTYSCGFGINPALICVLLLVLSVLIKVNNFLDIKDARNNHRDNLNGVGILEIKLKEKR